MAIALVGRSVWAEGANSQTPTIPSHSAGNMMVMMAVGKPFNLGWSVATSGWTALGRGESGTTAAGVDVGSMAAQVWWKEATSGAETNPTLTEGSPTWNVAGAAVYTFSKGASETWEAPVVVYGADETDGTAVSVTFASDPGVKSGDYVILLAGVNTDAFAPWSTRLTPSQTGVTFSVDATDDDSTTLGGDQSEHTSCYFVTSGTSSAAPTATGTGAASGPGDRLEAAFIRLRVTAATVRVPQTIVGDAVHRSFNW